MAEPRPIIRKGRHMKSVYIYRYLKQQNNLPESNTVYLGTGRGNGSLKWQRYQDYRPHWLVYWKRKVYHSSLLWSIMKRNIAKVHIVVVTLPWLVVLLVQEIGNKIKTRITWSFQLMNIPILTLPYGELYQIDTGLIPSLVMVGLKRYTFWKIQMMAINKCVKQTLTNFKQFLSNLKYWHF